MNTTFAANTALLYMLGMRYSTSDLSRKSGDIIARALQGPITITQRGKPRLILMSVEEYNRLRAKNFQYGGPELDSVKPA
jgi:prevent-host-death family protein